MGDKKLGLGFKPIHVFDLITWILILAVIAAIIFGVYLVVGN